MERYIFFIPPSTWPTLMNIVFWHPNFRLYYIIVTVDYGKNSNADTGLFMKVVPEKWKSAATVKLDSVAVAVNRGNSYNSTVGKVDRGYKKLKSPVATNIETAPFTTGYHHQWMDSVNKKLARLRLRIDSQKTTDDCDSMYLQ